MKCLMKYEWVKLMRSHLPQGKGVMGAWMKLASRAAFRKSIATYCGYKNEVLPGMWSGGIVGIKSILGIKKKSDALLMLDKLSELGYIKYELNSENKKLTYQITDWVVKCSGEECMNGTVYTTDRYGFLCLPRNITERLVSLNYKFEETDAWLDLWCHTVSNDAGNAFSFLAPVVQYGKYGALLTLENLGKRWNWEKTKVWRFFQKYRDVFTLYKMPGSYGCLVFNKLYPTDTETAIPSHEETVRILEEIRIYGQNTHKQTSDHEHINKLICWYSKNICQPKADEPQNNRVADSAYILRAYISPCRNCSICEYDCERILDLSIPVIEANNIRGPCIPVGLTKFEKEFFDYE